jgi:hypothetical protein
MGSLERIIFINKYIEYIPYYEKTYQFITEGVKTNGISSITWSTGKRNRFD